MAPAGAGALPAARRGPRGRCPASPPPSPCSMLGGCSRCRGPAPVSSCTCSRFLPALRVGGPAARPSPVPGAACRPPPSSPLAIPCPPAPRRDPRPARQPAKADSRLLCRVCAPHCAQRVGTHQHLPRVSRGLRLAPPATPHHVTVPKCGGLCWGCISAPTEMCRMDERPHGRVSSGTGTTLHPCVPGPRQLRLQGGFPATPLCHGGGRWARGAAGPS